MNPFYPAGLEFRGRTLNSQMEEIVVENLGGMTEPSVADFEKKRGVLAWNFDLEPKAEKELKTGYKITTPQSMHLSMNQ